MKTGANYTLSKNELKEALTQYIRNKRPTSELNAKKVNCDDIQIQLFNGNVQESSLFTHIKYILD